MRRYFTRRACLLCGFVFSVFTAALSGLDMGFSVYALPLKAAFNLTQSQVEMVASVASAGMAAGILETASEHWFGHLISCIVTWTMSPISSGLIAYFAAYQSGIVHSWPLMLYGLQLFLSIGLTLSFLKVTRICVDNFGKEHSGKLVGVYFASMSSGKIFFTLLTERYFENCVAGLFFVVAILTMGLIGVCLFFLYDLKENMISLDTDVSSEPPDRGETLTGDPNTNTKGSNSSSTKACKSVTDHVDDSQFPLLQGNQLQQQKHSVDRDVSSTKLLLLSPYFHLVLWPSAIMFAVTFTFMNNVTSIAQSVGLEEPLNTVYVISIFIVFSRIAFGKLLDKFSSEILGYAFLLFGYLCFILSIVLCVTFFNNTVLFVASGLLGIGEGVALAIPISIIVLHFGHHHYAIAVNGMYIVCPVFQILLQLGLGYLYDLQIYESGVKGTICYGLECFRVSFVCVIVLASIGSIIQIANCVWFRRRDETCI